VEKPLRRVDQTEDSQIVKIGDQRKL
jgi:hypothetical protein